MITSDDRAIVVDGIEKRFGATTALAGLSFTVEAGELFGFIGPDGAGKTTLFRILATLLLLPDAAGAARVPSYDPRMFTARAATSATVSREASACTSMSILAHGVSGIVSVGLKAVAFVDDTYR